MNKKQIKLLNNIAYKDSQFGHKLWMWINLGYSDQLDSNNSDF